LRVPENLTRSSRYHECSVAIPRKQQTVNKSSGAELSLTAAPQRETDIFLAVSAQQMRAG